VTRAGFLLVHRTVGLATAAFLVVAGLTGSLIAFHHELDVALNPSAWGASAGSPLTLSTQIAAIEAAHPEALVRALTVPPPGEAAIASLRPRRDSAGKPLPLAATQLLIDPATARELGARTPGKWPVDTLHVVPFLYQLHHTLLAGEAGAIAMGVVGLLWFFDSFVALVLAWPKKRHVVDAFTVRLRRTNAARFTYDLHRAFGLWAFAVLLMLGLTGAWMNLRDEAFDPVVERLWPRTPSPEQQLPKREDPTAPVATPLDVAEETARRTLVERGIPHRLGSVALPGDRAAYAFRFHTPDDVMHEHPGLRVVVSGDTGALLGVRASTGESTGDAIAAWLFPLHSGKAAGLAGRIVVCAAGLVVVLLSCTGTLLWARRRRRAPPRRM
jgi:uncharacterized iron-regulated membrane protein